MLSLLERLYGQLPSPPRDPFGFYVWEVLSHHATPRQAEAALQALKRSRALTPDAMHRAPRGKIQAAVALSGSYLDSRLQALQAGTTLFRRSPGLTVGLPKTLRSAHRVLLSMPHLGRPGVHRMLLFAGDHPVFPIDSSIDRLFLRLGEPDPLSPRRSQRRLRATIVSGLPHSSDAYRRAFLYFSHHASMTCTESPRCGICPLLPDCAEGRRRMSAADVEASPHGKRV
jgi:endonuclease III